MANTREWPTGILCVSFWGITEAYVVRRPTTYQNLIATAASLFRASFDEKIEELYVKTDDFGLEWPVEVLPDVWEMPEVQGFLRTVEFHARVRGEGPSQLDFTGAEKTQTTIPLSPSSTPPRDIPGRPLTHSTPAKRRAKVNKPVDDEPASGGYRGHSEDEEAEQPEPGSSGRMRSRVSLQARGSRGNPRPIKIIRAEPTKEEIAPSSSPGLDIVAETKIQVTVVYEDTIVTVKARPRHSFSSLLKTACKNLGIDKDTVKLFQMVAFDGRNSMSPIECNLSLSMEGGNVTSDDVFLLLPYNEDDED